MKNMVGIKKRQFTITKTGKVWIRRNWKNNGKYEKERAYRNLW